MNDAINNPVKRQYNKRELNTAEINVDQLPDVDLSLDKVIIHGDVIPQMSERDIAQDNYMNELRFNEEPVTIMINENSRSDFPETHVPVQVNGRGAEVLVGDTWVESVWLPIGREITTKRKYVEILVRSKSTAIQTKHEDATVERPNNTVMRRVTQNYPVQVLHDANPRGRQWITDITRTN